MRILIAGGAGYIGSVLVPLLLEHECEVTVVDQLWFGTHLPEGVTVVERELFDYSAADMEDYDQVIFLAGLSNDPMAEFRPAMNFVLNSALPSYLAHQAKLAGVSRFIYASSCSVYGYTLGELYDEEAPVTCGYPYGISKLQGERGVLQLQDETFSTISLRQGTVCGYSPRMRFDLVVNTMFKTATQEGEIKVSNPAIWRPILDVRDTAQAFLRAVQAEPSVHGVFNVARDNFTVGQIADLVKDEVEALTGRQIRLHIDNVRDYRNYKVSCEKARNHLAFQPRFGIGDMVRSIHDRVEELGDLDSDNYYNIKVFRQLVDERRGSASSDLYGTGLEGAGAALRASS